MQNYCSILFCQADPITCTIVVKLWLSYCLHVQDSYEQGRMGLGHSSRGAASFHKPGNLPHSGVGIVLITDADGINPTAVSLIDVSLVHKGFLNECQVRGSRES